MIAGEGLIGILLAVFAIFGIDKVIDLSSVTSGLPVAAGNILSILVFAVLIAILVFFSVKKNKTDK